MAMSTIKINGDLVDDPKRDGPFRATLTLGSLAVSARLGAGEEEFFCVHCRTQLEDGGSSGFLDPGANRECDQNPRMDRDGEPVLDIDGDEVFGDHEPGRPDLGWLESAEMRTQGDDLWLIVRFRDLPGEFSLRVYVDPDRGLMAHGRGVDGLGLDTPMGQIFRAALRDGS